MQLRQDTTVDVKMSVQGVTETVEVTAAIVPAIERDSTAIKSGVSSETIQVAAGRPGVPRPAQAHSGRPVFAGCGSRAERGRQRPGQRLQVRRRERHAAALRHAVRGPVVARHRPGDDDQGRRQGRRFRPRGGLLRRLGEQVRARSSFHGMLELSSSRATPWRPSLNSGSLSRYEQDRNWLDGQRRRPAHQEQAVLLRVVLPARARPEQRVERVRRAAGLQEHPERGVRQVHRDAGQLGAGQRDLAASRTRSRHRRHLRTDHRADGGHRQRVLAEDRDGRRLVGHQLEELPLLQVHALREPDAGPAGQHRRRDAEPHAGGTKLDIAALDRMGLFTVPVPVAGNDAFNAFIAPIIDRYGYVSNGVKSRRRHGRVRHRVQQAVVLP